MDFGWKKSELIMYGFEDEKGLKEKGEGLRWQLLDAKKDGSHTSMLFALFPVSCLFCFNFLSFFFALKILVIFF